MKLLQSALLSIAALKVFNRSPARTIPTAIDAVVSPADGIVEAIDGQYVQIFIRISDVHVQRIPFSGTIESITNDNDYYDSMIINTLFGPITLDRKGGVLARSLRTYVLPGQNVNKGMIYGRIVLGSHAYITLPESFQIHVNERQILKAGETVIATLKN